MDARFPDDWVTKQSLKIDKEAMGKLLTKTISRLKHSASKNITRIGESFARKAVCKVTPPKSGPGSGLVKRAKTETSINTAVASTHSFSKDSQQKNAAIINGFHSFDVVPRVPFDTPPLTEAQLEKAKAMLLKSNAVEKAGLREIITLQGTQKATRQDFTPAVWKALDAINFELTQDHLTNLCDLFNGEYHSKVVSDCNKHGVDWNESLIAETFAKALAYTQDIDDKSIMVPVKNEGENVYELKEFHITKYTIGEELPCYVLKCPQQKSWIIPRGTEIMRKKTEEGQELRQGAMESILADCDAKGIGYRALGSEGGKIQLENILNNAGEDSIIAGHSLGGLLANEITARYSDRIAKCYGFSAPGISKGTYKDLQPEQKIFMEGKICNFQAEGDLVPSAGRYVIGKNFAVGSASTDAIHSHLQHNLNRPKVQLTLIDNKKESEKLMRKLSETTRMGVGGVVLKVTAIMGKAPTWHGHR